jgi:hypothetical protein
MGKLKKTSVTAFKVIAGAAIAAATAIAGFVAASIANAIADERSQIRLTAALEARGLATEKNTKKIEEAIIAGQKFAFSGEQIRTSLEIATQFTSNFSKAISLLLLNAPLTYRTDRRTLYSIGVHHANTHRQRSARQPLPPHGSDG